MLFLTTKVDYQSFKADIAADTWHFVIISFYLDDVWMKQDFYFDSTENTSA